MSNMPFRKYKPFAPVPLADRTWPNRSITRAPVWCSVDLRDGNQALPEPMGPTRKARMFHELVRMGFKHIEVGFPAASQPDFDFVRQLIETDMIPDDVTIQVLTQAREHLIDRTMHAIAGARRAIVHIYNSTSTLQRRVVYGLSKDGIIDIAVQGARCIKERVASIAPTEVLLEYSPESFTGTEIDFAKDICESVMDAWGVGPGRHIILNLPATVEMSTPNVYADQIEWFSRHIKAREHIVLSVHPHNDRGTAIAAAELALMAGADRVEGTLFGNGERTGNVDVVTLALNMLTQGIDPQLDIRNIQALVGLAEYCNQLPVHPRHPYAGNLVYTAFSGSHQDAIRKGLHARRQQQDPHWEVPYLPIDPADLGRSYEAIIRINSQSGKGGVGYVLETDHGLRLPRGMLMEFSRVVQHVAERDQTEVSSATILACFEREYLHMESPHFVLRGQRSVRHGDGPGWQFTLGCGEDTHVLVGTGNGPIDALARSLRHNLGFDVRITDYVEHTLSAGSDACAVAFVEVAGPHGSAYGAAKHTDVAHASLAAMISAMNRLFGKVTPLGLTHSRGAAS